MNNLKPLREGVVRDSDTGLLYLPPSKRADGTWRKPIRIKEGYIPQDEMPIFESIGNKFANGITKGPVGLPPGVGSASDKRISNDAGLSKTARKNLRRKDRKRDAADSASTATEPDDSPATFSYDASMHRVSECSTRKSGRLGGESSTLGVEEKRVKALRKKLRQIDKLSADIDDGVIANADPDQVAKVNSRSKVELELQSLVDNMRIE